MASKPTAEVLVVSEKSAELLALEAEAAEVVVAEEHGALAPPIMAMDLDKKTGKFSFYIKLGLGQGEVVQDGNTAEFILCGRPIQARDVWDAGLGKSICSARDGVLRRGCTSPQANSCFECSMPKWDDLKKGWPTILDSQGKAVSCREKKMIPAIYVGHRNDPEAPFELCMLTVSPSGLSAWTNFSKTFEKQAAASKFHDPRKAARPTVDQTKVCFGVTLSRKDSANGPYAVPTFNLVGFINDPQCLHPDLYARALKIQIGYNKALAKYGLAEEVDGNDIAGNAQSRERAANEGNPPGVGDEDLPF